MECDTQGFGSEMISLLRIFLHGPANTQPSKCHIHPDCPGHLRVLCQDGALGGIRHQKQGPINATLMDGEAADGGDG